MSEVKKDDKAHPPAEKKGGGMPSGGAVFGLLAGVGLGGCLLFMLLGIGFGSFIESIGAAKRHYPEIVMGFIALVFAGAAFSARKKEKKEEH